MSEENLDALAQRTENVFEPARIAAFEARVMMRVMAIHGATRSWAIEIARAARIIAPIAVCCSAIALVLAVYTDDDDDSSATSVEVEW